ncbi:hypothetical protein LguiB_024005 [Lonicera macranthoides]
MRQRRNQGHHLGWEWFSPRASFDESTPSVQPSPRSGLSTTLTLPENNARRQMPLFGLGLHNDEIFDEKEDNVWITIILGVKSYLYPCELDATVYLLTRGWLRAGPEVVQDIANTNLNLEELFSVHAGIAHTRWVTHGEPAPRNCHPQSSGPGNEFVVVHNGVITNYEVLKETLIRHGFIFESETDTEVIPKLAKFVFDKAHEGDHTITVSQVVLEVMRHLEGAYALIFKSRHYPNELITCKRGSPLLLGIKEFTEDASIKASFNDAKFFSADGGNLVSIRIKIINSLALLARPASVQRALSILEKEVEQINKGEYEHYMQKEIQEQPESLTTTMQGRLIRGDSTKAKTVLLGGLKDHLKTIRRSRRIVFIGCSTSYNAALASRPILEELSGIPATIEIASDLLDRQGPIYREDTVVFVSQSVSSAIARNTHCGVHINAGCEIGVASTKAYTSQIVVMAMLALAIGSDTISSQANCRVCKVREVLRLDKEMKDLAKSLIAEQSLLLFGRGYNYATALEGTLKVKEVALMHSEGILAGEMKHGPLALVDENLPIVVIATRDACFSKQQSVIQQLHARKGRLIPVINIVPLQLLAYHLTVLRGYNVDQPQNLAKSEHGVSMGSVLLCIRTWPLYRTIGEGNWERERNVLVSLNVTTYEDPIWMT